MNFLPTNFPMVFDSPPFLWAALLALAWGAVTAVLLARNYRRRQRKFLESAREVSRVPPGGLRLKMTSHWILIATLVLLAIAAARPHGAPVRSSDARKGVNLALVIDGSRSMSSEDALPSRLEVARRAVDAAAQECAGSRISLFMFGGAPTLLIPATFDLTAVSLAARSISPDFVGKGGSSLGPAITRAADYLNRNPGNEPKVILLISDGEEGESDPLLAAMQARAERGVTIHTITVGTEAGGPMPTYERNRKGELVRSGEWRNADKQPIITRANPTLMSRVAESAGGRSLHLTGGDLPDAVRHFVSTEIMSAAVVIDDVATQERREWWWVPVLAAVVLLFVEQLLRRFATDRFFNQPRQLVRTAVLGDAEAAPITRSRRDTEVPA